MNEYELQHIIRKWVTNNFGKNEAEEPSWDIEALSNHIAKHFNKKEEYNGWSNYATWRINLEMIDSEMNAILEDGQKFHDSNELAEHLKQGVEDYIDMASTGTMGATQANPVNSYAHAFINDVNWLEIADSAIADNPKLIK